MLVKERSLMSHNPFFRQLWGAVVAVGLIAVAMPALAGKISLGEHEFTLPDGFTIERVASSPLVDRPITADFDEQGRLYVADSSGSNDPVQKQLEERPHRIVRLEDTNGDGVFDKSHVFADRLMFPEGTMWLDGSLYVATPPSIWKLTDTDGDGVADQRIEWFQGKTLTGCANDLHGPYLGPDGWIYWCKGAFAEQHYTFRGQSWKSRASHIFRCRPDGTGLEPVMTGGMDNPVDIAFTPSGDRILTNTFLIQPGHGQRDGLLHVIYGGVYGKQHGVLDGHIRTGELMPVLSHFGAAAPCGLTSYDCGVFGEAFRDNLFACQFNMHKVSRHVLKRDGASYASQDSDFVVSNQIDFHPTDVLADADGSLVVVDTGGWYKLCCPTSQLSKPDILGAIYRVRRVGAKQVEDPRGQKIDWAGLTTVELLPLVSDDRPAVRRLAVEELVRRRGEPETVRALASLGKLNPPLVWAMIRLELPSLRGQIRRALNDGDETCQLAALHGVSLVRDADANATLLRLVGSGSPAVRRAAAEALGRIGNRAAAPALLAAAEQAEGRALEHSIIYALIELADPAATAKGLASKSPRVQRAAMIALDQMASDALTPGFVAARLDASDASVQETAHWILSHRPEWGGALAAWCQKRLSALSGSTDDQTAAQLESQLVQFAGNDAIRSLLASVAADSKSSTAARRAALHVMAQVRPKDLPQAWANALAQVAAGNDADLTAAAVAAARSVPAQKTPSPALNKALLALAGQTSLAAQIRLEAMAAVMGGMREVSNEQFELLLASLAVDQPLATRSAAADAIAAARLSPQQLDRLTEAVKTVGPLELERLLVPFQRSTDEALGLKLLASLKSASSLPSTHFDRLRQYLAKYGPSVQQQIDEAQSLVNVDAAAQRARIEELLPSVASGDIRRGQIVFNSSKAACLACHRFGYQGNNVGPDLTRIGKIRTERDLLESILYPSLSFVRSYEPIVIATTDGRIVNGLIRNETETELVIATAPNQEVRIRRDEIDQTQPSTVSVMPAGLEKQLSIQELLDLVRFLKNTENR
jgi:putative membrane-bound dehydrogenase-like protein